MIYLIKSGNYLKIGFAENVNKRMQCYITHNPDFELLDTKEGTTNDEKIIHKLCSPWLHRNEWFKDVPEVRKFWNDYQETTEYNIIKLKEEIEALKNKLKNSVNYESLKQEYQNKLKDNYEKIAIILNEISKVLLENNKQIIINIIERIIKFSKELIRAGKRNELNQNTENLLCDIVNNIEQLLKMQQ